MNNHQHTPRLSTAVPLSFPIGPIPNVASSTSAFSSQVSSQHSGQRGISLMTGAQQPTSPPISQGSASGSSGILTSSGIVKPIPVMPTCGMHVSPSSPHDVGPPPHLMRSQQPLPKHPNSMQSPANPAPTPSTSWFHGSLSREETELRLRVGTPGSSMNGTFLIRYSPSTRKYVLSVVHEMQCYHYPIDELPDGFYRVSGTNAKYLGLDLLVSEFRRSATTSIVCTLTHTVSGGMAPPAHIIVYGRTHELHHAIRKANLKKVREVLARNSSAYGSGISSGTIMPGDGRLWDIINEKSADSGATPLIEAAKIGSNDIVKLLLEQGADVTLRDCAGFTALHRACQRSFAHIVETLCKRSGRAACVAPDSATPWLFEPPSPVPMKCPFTGNTALHEAAILGHMDCCQTLVRYHAAVWARNVEGEMPFELALRFGFRQLAEALSSYRPPQPLTTREDWFHPTLSKSDTERILSQYSHLDGTFLVRRSSQNDRKFVLVLIYQSQALKYQIDVVHDFAFNTDTKEAYFIDKGPLHLTLEHLIEHYSRFADGIPSRLRFALPPKPKLTAAGAAGSGTNPNANLIEMERLLPAGVPQAEREPLQRVLRRQKPPPPVGPISPTPGPQPGKVGGQMSPPMLVNQTPPSLQPATSGIGALPPAVSSVQTPMSQQQQQVPSSAVNGGAAVSSSADTQQIRLIASDSVILLCRLGEGEFGEVYSGELHRPNGTVEEVAVKVLVQPSHRLDFLKEASIMMQLQHGHIIRLYGVCENKRLMMLLELAPLGSLLDYLLDYPEKCQLPQLYTWAMQIASGMCYLEQSGFVHRDLACRNVLLQSAACAKISDFGLSRAVGMESDYYRATSRGKWPVKWYAPESIYYKQFSHASDVWSYGVCLWEMLSLGEHPYAEEDSFEVLRSIEEGRRLGQPALASDEVYAIMRQCWAYRSEARPTFQQLYSVFEHLSTNVYENVDLPDNCNHSGNNAQQVAVNNR